MRANNIGLLNYLLGFNQPGAPWNPQQQQHPQQSPMPQGGGGPRGLPAGSNGWGYTPGQQGMSPTPQGGIGGGMPGAIKPSMSMGGMLGGPNTGAPMPGAYSTALGSGMANSPFGQSNIPAGADMAAVARWQQSLNPTGMMQNLGGGGGPALGLGGPAGAAGGAAGGMLGMFSGGGDLRDMVAHMMGGGGGGSPMPQGGAPQFSQSPMLGGAPQGSPLQRGNAGAQFGQMPNTGASIPGSPMPAYGQQAGGGFSTQLPQGGATNGPLDRIESYFGPLGTPTTALQQQSMGGISQFLNSNPYGQSNNALSQIMGTGPKDYFGGAQNAFQGLQNKNYFGATQNQANKLAGGDYFGGATNAFKGLQGENPFQPAQGALEGMFKQNPGQGMVQALEPMYQRALAAANQDGGRFGSANAIMRSHALDDYNLAAQKALQYGTDQQINAAGQYGQMGGSLLNAHLGAAQGLLGVGNGQVQQGIGAGQLMLGAGQGQSNQAISAAQGLLGIGTGRSNYANQFMGNQINAAGQLANNQNSMFNNYQNAYNTGSQQATQEAQRQQQSLQILSGLLGTSQSASLGGPSVVQPNAGQQAIQAGLSTLPYVLGGGGGGGGSPMPFNNPGAAAPSFGIPYGF